MSGALIDPELETFPNRYRWTVEACYRLMELGFLEGRFEVIDGEVINKMGQKPPHSVCLTRLYQILATLFGADHIRMQSPIELPGEDGIYTEPEPDVAITSDTAAAFEGRHPRPADLFLVVEVSDTTLRTDLVVKSRLYARVGIAEFWCVDLNQRKLHIHRQPIDGTYSVVTVHLDSDTVTVQTHPEAAIAVADLFPVSDVH
jgi:Uma2 family endonuclease